MVENHLTDHADLAYWRDAAQAEQFRNVFQPAVIQMHFRFAGLENPERQYWCHIGPGNERQSSVRELAKTSLVMRAQGCRAEIICRVRPCAGVVVAMTPAVSLEKSDLFERIAQALPPNSAKTIGTRWRT
ncbi:MAG: hypothetical protein JOZ62_20700 [Acidobacteriaceae bacterium]|nr:hypothetical protein [Acidobacteriaceae bacterium]